MLKHFLLFAFIFSLGCGVAAEENQIEPSHPPELSCNADELKRTIVTPYLEQPITSWKNVLWCSTMQISWNELCELIGEDVHMENEDLMVSILNKKEIAKECLDESTYIALAGTYEDGITEKIASQLQKRGSSIEEFPELNNLGPGGFAAFSYLSAEMSFEYLFDRSRQPFEFNGNGVACFGVNHNAKDQESRDKKAGQVLIEDYKNKDDFIIEIKTKNKKPPFNFGKNSSGGNTKKNHQHSKKKDYRTLPGKPSSHG